MWYENTFSLIWTFLGWLGVFLFGMYTFEHAIRILTGDTFKERLERYTHGACKSILWWTIVTGIVQSSTLVSLICIAFVGAGVMHLSNAIGMVIGANIGTTLTSVLVARLWFGKISISAFAFPIIAIGWISLIFLKKQRSKERAKLLIWFWLLFLGLDIMKESIEIIQETFNLAQYADRSLAIFFLIWLLLTWAIQSSSATWVITLAALSAWIISFPASIAIVMWANIGTTITPVLASLEGKPIKRQVALSQVLFNIISAIIWIILFRPLIWLVQEILWFKENLIMWNALLNLIFNTLTALLFVPFLQKFTKRIRKIIPD